MLKVGIIREDKIPVDKRSPLTPAQCQMVANQFGVDVKVQKSDVRVFLPEEYSQHGIEMVDDISNSDILLGVKEVPMEKLIAEKTYFFFSHTIKEQEYNRELLQTILKKKIKLVDYECLLDSKTNQRIVAFGRFAGIVGAYNTIWTFGQRYNLFNIRRAHECYDLADMKTEFEKVELPAIKIAITGGGRVAKGAMEVMYGMNILQVSPHEFLNERFDRPVFAQLSSHTYHKKKDGGAFNRDEFYENPGLYEGDFLKYAKVADMLIAGAFWDPRAPVLFTKEDAVSPEFKTRIIGDVTCDIEGSIPSTKKPATVDDPVYDYNPTTDTIEPEFSEESNITVMAVDNLPCELPRDASESFGQEMIDNVLPHLLGEDKEDVIKNATIAENGKLTERYSYLQGYVDGQ
ncbi:alanine dehydrogenase [Marivirga tractuosa]|uniref:Saccharopine dehydrogenase [NAD(+), L-lysine-forming] n=1 Tax=Marivirga tractuosa (strain ATCC 23168 / DSM 4126 / NBRC 15989 / NCIMB 1408 / VKM B-1430 / H-43) TaxID=643867 RepID=E4TRR0_MARTH|nr:NAD(P)-dependent oxidoreductase [Marivirga tractuosa]ADR22759.1 alanine dehydrogenase/PNT domain protein [Marivirga tractuosa DSM 4126]BDD16570.1 alanine dehydrogenase [Marivirga tractuosa]